MLSKLRDIGVFFLFVGVFIVCISWASFSLIKYRREQCAEYGLEYLPATNQCIQALPTSPPFP
jgi:hypothetical protein